MSLQFPSDFRILENPFLEDATNYIYSRDNGSIISILEHENGNSYEVWDEQYMMDIEIMNYDELFQYLQKEWVRQLISNINYN